jgi:DNA (cytosine-5)-methyltransferase 1
MSEILWSDFFCGAGGSSTGLKAAGAEVLTAINHWQLALDSHHTNHPDTNHVLTDISTSDPRRLPTTACAWMSPECTHHSRARGEKRKKIHGQMMLAGFGEKNYDPAAERSRMTAWDVVRYSEVHRYRIVVVENVVELADWELYSPWLIAMQQMGYDYKELYLNAMFFGVPQSRDRMYVVFWQRRQQAPNLEFHPQGFCKTCNLESEMVQVFKRRRWGEYKRQYVYVCSKCGRAAEPYRRGAGEIIDWSIKPQLIGDRKRPLSPNTMARIEYGLRKYGLASIVETAYSHAGPKRATSTETPFPSQTTAQTLGLAVSPEIMRRAFITSYYSRENASSSVHQPLPTVVTENRFGLVLPYYGTPNTHGVGEPLPTVTTKERSALLSGDAESLNLDECGYRMVNADEVKQAMGFPDTYTLLGTQKEQVHQAGNAVCAPVAQAIAQRCMETL